MIYVLVDPRSIKLPRLLTVGQLQFAQCRPNLLTRASQWTNAAASLSTLVRLYSLSTPTKRSRCDRWHRRRAFSKALLYHYFPSKIELFKAAVAEKAEELGRLIEPSGEGDPFEQLTAGLDAYLGWIADNADTWSKLMQSATTVPEARELIEDFRQHTIDLVLSRLTSKCKARPALRIAIKGWLGYMDAAILDWTQANDLAREKLRDLLLAAFAASLFAAQQADPNIQLNFNP